MMALITVSMALAFAAPDADIKDETKIEPARVEQAVEMPKRLSSAELARLRTGGVPSNCEVFWLPDPVTGELRCEAVVCRDEDDLGIPEIFDCSEFGL